MEKDKEYLSNYLSKIKSSSKNIKYKRVTLSPLRYAGGKSKAVGLILENLPELKKKKNCITFLWWWFFRDCLK